MIDSDEHFLSIILPALVNSSPTLPIARIRQEQQDDRELYEIYSWKIFNQKPTENSLTGKSEILRFYAECFDDIEIRENILGLTDPETKSSFRILVPRTLTEEIIQSIHDNIAHEGSKKVAYRVARTFFWPNMMRDIKLYISTCAICDRFKLQGKTYKNPLTPIRVGYRGETLAIDVIGGKETLPMTPRGNKYILTMIDLFTRYVVAVALPNQHALTVCDALINRFVLIYGAPSRILSDQGRNFESAIFANFCTLFRIKKCELRLTILLVTALAKELIKP